MADQEKLRQREREDRAGEHVSLRQCGETPRSASKGLSRRLAASSAVSNATAAPQSGCFFVVRERIS